MRLDSLAILCALAACRPEAPASSDHAPASYIDSQRCAACHPAEAARWTGSHHDRAMEVATPASVQGDFGDVTAWGTRFRRDGEAYVIEVATGASTQRHRVRYTFGVEPLQQYLVELPGGRLQVFALAWDTVKRSWFRVAPDDVPWTGRYQTWNTMCAECHSTAVDKRYDPAADRFDTTYEEIDVGCQACHGPGSRHASDPRQPLDASRTVEACAGCHARRTAIAHAERPGAPLFDQFRPMTLLPGLYYPDGQIRDEVFEYGSFAQSVMHERGVTCVDCHDPHSAGSAPANTTCTQCHSANPPARFPGLAARAANVDSPAHHHHAPGSPGARCVSCHMPGRTYMAVDGRRDHSFRIPRPDLSVALDTPNACTQSCHADRDARWAADAVAAWFPAPRPPHFGEVFQRGVAGGASPELQRLAGDRNQPAIVRATALEMLFADPRPCIAAAAPGLRDPSPLVRSIAVACGEHLPPAARLGFAADALSDPARLVRIEAARILSGAPVAAMTSAQRAAHAAARRELEASYRLQLDRPEGWFNLGALAEAESRPEDAIRHYRQALALDPEFVPAKVNLEQVRAAAPAK